LRTRTGGWLALLFLSGCAGIDSYPVPAEPEDMTLTTREQAEAASLPAWTLTMPLGERRDGTELVLEFLKYAESTGARYVTEVNLVLGVEQQGRPVECRTRIGPIRPASSAQRPDPSADSPETRPWRVSETRMVSEPQLRCRMVTDSRLVPETHMESEYDSFSKSHRMVPRTRMVMRHDTRQECQHETVQRSVTRYVYQFHTGFIPPDLEEVARYQPRLTLAESAPECTPIEPGDGRRTGLAHRIEARVHGCMDITLPPEVNKPEAEMNRAERLRHQYRLKALAERGEQKCADRVIRLEPRPETPEPSASGNGSADPCRDTAPPEVNKPEAEMNRAERLRHAYRLKALAAGKKDCEAGKRSEAAEGTPETDP
jgi:hypothetical protein